jgi:hypothetical protein
MLFDPPLTTVYAGSKESTKKSVEPNSLYKDVDNAGMPKSQAGPWSPQKKTIFEDTSFYLYEYPTLIEQDRRHYCNEHDSKEECTEYGSSSPCMGWNSPALASSFIMKRMIKAHYAVVLGFLDHQVESMGSRGWSIGQHNQESIDEFQNVKKYWLSFRSAPIRANLDNIFDALGISRYGPDVSRGQKDWQYDFRWLKMRLSNCSKAYQAITTDIATLSNIITSHQAVEENKRAAEATTKTSEETSQSVEIQILAFILIPMGLIASLFSMTDDYPPGRPKFWVYWAVSVPFTSFVLAAVWLRRLISAGRLPRLLIRMRRIVSRSGTNVTDPEIELVSPRAVKDSQDSDDPS